MSGIDKNKTNLERDIQPMPDDVRERLDERGLMTEYHARPDHQQNDDLAWIGRARRSGTREKRIDQMLDELDRGGVYMRMNHPPSAKAS